MKIQIKAASYGTPNAGKDVTAIVQELINSGKYNVPINNNTFDCDPDPGIEKELGIVYLLEDGNTLARASL